MARHPDTSEIRSNQILDAATKVFVRQGFKHARMDDIVEESGLSKGTLYWYFKSKEDIINAILRRLFAGDLEHLKSLLFASLHEGLTLHWLMDPETVQWEILSENSIPMLLDGLKVRPYIAL